MFQTESTMSELLLHNFYIMLAYIVPVLLIFIPVIAISL